MTSFKKYMHPYILILHPTLARPLHGQTLELKKNVSSRVYTELLARLREAEEAASMLTIDDDDPALAGLELRLCPACFVRIEKNEGCQQMCCYRCGHNFSWPDAKIVERVKKGGAEKSDQGGGGERRSLQFEAGAEFAVGEKVEARYRGRSRYYSGEITRLVPRRLPDYQHDMYRFDIRYDDGETEQFIDPRYKDTFQPTFQPTLQPTFQPTFQPAFRPTFQPTEP